MSHKVTVDLDRSLYEKLVWISDVSDIPIDKLLILAARETYVNEELESSKTKQDSLLANIDNWLDNIREGTATNEDFNLAKESASKLQKEIRKTRLKIKNRATLLE
ncbi:hypothetical protein [Bacillus sp. ISL-39]|uniref:hypothetical protein n=1 Tax=Bacillus sp. ISL-39 TaxID=2819124 RepID=UPI001BE4E6CD|nr:hypothetical protein [Bacillus sp. ISL-39]MBT2639375.1 hypothetical protein [Bacillus sp. ISL-39]